MEKAKNCEAFVAGFTLQDAQGAGHDAQRPVRARGTRRQRHALGLVTRLAPADTIDTVVETSEGAIRFVDGVATPSGTASTVGAK